MTKTEYNNYCNRELKKEYKWLKEVDKFALTNTIYHLDSAYQNFFREIKKKNNKQGFPKFKSKHNHYYSYTTNFTNNNIKVDFDKSKIQLPKLKWIKAKLHRKFNGRILFTTVSCEASGKYCISFNVECENKIEKKKKLGNGKIGIDLGIKDLLINSNGKCYSNEKIRNKRIDNLHKISTKIISENQVIISEDLNIEGMVQNKHLSKSIYDVGWGELIRQIQYKAEWNKRVYRKINRFYASSQICNECGYKNVEIKDLRIRKWTCPNCGIGHNRDKNAAINILIEGLRILEIKK